jgi:hypothetical protein
MNPNRGKDSKADENSTDLNLTDELLTQGIIHNRTEKSRRIAMDN